MTRRDYEKTAAILAGARAIATTDAERYRVEGIAYSLADMFASDNPLFDREKFYAAANVDRSRFVEGVSFSLVDLNNR